MMQMQDLRDRHAGETAYIVGCGPSLAHLRAEHFGPGPVIALNDAIMLAQALGLPNALYTLQKDGCFDGRACYCQGEGALVRLLESTTLIVQRVFSEYCFPGHARRLVVDVRDLGFTRTGTMSIRMAAALARQMGCSKIVFACCDSLVTKDARRFDITSGTAFQTTGSAHYLPNNPRLLRDLGKIPREFLTPQEQA